VDTDEGVCLRLGLRHTQPIRQLGVGIAPNGLRRGLTKTVTDRTLDLAEFLQSISLSYRCRKLYEKLDESWDSGHKLNYD